ncbi:MAG: hypothetical protein M1308_15790 [Actinobacteria bacterium]|nr:hypothetical protein [Actinomycetota bacterium]
MFYKKNNPYKKISKKHNLVFTLICMAFLLFFILTCIPAVTRTIIYYPQDEIEKTNRKKINMPLEQAHFIPEIGDFIIMDIKAENIGNVKYPSGSIAVNWKHAADKTSDVTDTAEIKEQQTFKIVIDGLKHSYYIPIGENPAWAQNSGPSSFIDGDSNNNNNVVSDNFVSSVSIESPEIEGIEIKISDVRLVKRLIFPLDSYINYRAKKLMNIEQTNRFATPAYIFLTFSLILFFIYILLYRRVLLKEQSSISLKNETFKDAFANILKDEKQKIPPAKILIFISTAILLAFSFYFIALNSFTIKSYVDSYGQYILQAKFDKTYEGFYNFKRFISWIGQKVPEGENIIVLLRGEPVYIMSEMAYNLYPRDIKYIDASKKNDRQILSQIKEINRTGKNNKLNYKYIVILSAGDIPQSEDLELIDKYRENGGFLYKLK